nr:MAG TPA: hypothetical protein [Caudoviricetes sp.]
MKHRLKSERNHSNAWRINSYHKTYCKPLITRRHIPLYAAYGRKKL